MNKSDEKSEKVSNIPSGLSKTQKLLMAQDTTLLRDKKKRLCILLQEMTLQNLTSHGFVREVLKIIEASITFTKFPTCVDINVWQTIPIQVTIAHLCHLVRMGILCISNEFYSTHQILTAMAP